MATKSCDTMSLAASAQVQLLNDGNPLGAFDEFYDGAVMMYSNGELFASGTAEGRAKQEPYINAAIGITGHITDFTVIEEKNLCIFRNRSNFIDSDGNSRDIDGLCWQRWAGRRVVEEKYFDGEQMIQRIDQGVLLNPAILLDPGNGL